MLQFLLLPHMQRMRHSVVFNRQTKQSQLKNKRGEMVDVDKSNK
jgi:hypothetical protein